jgi:hypothetical protein
LLQEAIYLDLCSIARSYFGLNRVRVPVINQKLIFLQQFGYFLDLFLDTAVYRPASSDYGHPAFCLTARG